MYTGKIEPVSNLATWRETVELTEDGEPVDIVTDVDSITIHVRDPLADNVVLSGSTADGVVTVSNLTDGVFEFVFSAGQMAGVDAGTYELGCLIKFSDNLGGDTEQVILGTVPVLRGL